MVSILLCAGINYTIESLIDSIFESMKQKNIILDLKIVVIYYKVISVNIEF